MKRRLFFFSWILIATSLLSAQNVGIGIDTPLYPLTLRTPDGYGFVQDNDSVRIGTALVGNSHGFLGTFTDHLLILSAGTGESNPGDIYINPDGNIGLGALPNDAQVHILPESPQQNLLDIQNFFGEPTLLVSGYGYIGMGTSSPAFPLTLKTSGGYGFVHENDSIGIGTFLNEDGRGWIGTTSNHPFQLGSNATDNITIDTTGYIGMGTSAPAYPLTLKTSGGYGFVHENDSMRIGTFLNEDGIGWIGTMTNHPLQLGYNGIGNLTMDTTGNVGIGIATPIAKLHVEGGTYMNGGLKLKELNLLEFGADLPDKEINAGKIGYNAFGQNALTIVGAGNTLSDRAVYFYAEGGTTFKGKVVVTGNMPAATSLAVTGETKLNKTDSNPIALDINGGIKVSGTAPAAFRLIANSSNMYDDTLGLSTDYCRYIRIDNAYANNNPDALIMITPLEPSPVCAWYYVEDGYWYIRSALQWRFGGLTDIGDCNLGCAVIQNIPVSGAPVYFIQNFDKFNIFIITN
ncbi:MAG TPA: hypothetical protein PLV75_04975 [Saprospiraceae bacterium]|nr:hypothetical protein [Saprospiraceae bacterium]HQW25282.1 hypothetical protein [Saprospiraceae bacterium]